MNPIWLPFGLKPKKTTTEEEGAPRYVDIYERGLAAAVDVCLLFFMLRWLFDLITVYFFRMANQQDLRLAQQAATTLEAAQHAWDSGFPQLWLLNALVQILILGVFFVGSQVAWGTTPGKWLMGISIRRRDLSPPEPWRYVLRYLAYIPSAPLFFWISFNKKRRTIHDLIAGTVVIHTRPKGWVWMQVKRGYRWLRNRASATAVE